jgi:hypothetical protein
MSSITSIARFGSPSALHDFFVEVEDVADGEDRFPARNFRLDEGVPSNRAVTYEGVVRSPTWERWPAAHRSYLERHVEWRVGRIPPPFVDEASRATPETFGRESLCGDFGQMSARTDLIRVTTPWHIARDARLAPADVSRALDRPGALDPILRMASSKRERLPEFVAIWDDVADLLPSESAQAPLDWADRLRDRLGLSHYAPRTGQAQVIMVFVFPVARIPKFIGLGGNRALVVPTVLDARLFPAFCPAPTGTRAGRVVDLGSELEPPRRELLIPPVELRESDLFRVGAVNEPAPALTEPRAAHILMIRDEYSRPDYAAATDADLL